MGNLGAQKAKRNDTPISAKKDIMGDKTVRVRADLHHIIKIETAKNGGNVKEVMEIRLRVDIPNSLDDIWGIDITKRTATIPRNILNQLRKTVKDAMDIATRKQTHRGRKENVDANISYIWNRMQGRNNNFYYELNKENPLFKNVKDHIPADYHSYIDIMLDEIQLSIPIQQIYIDRCNEAIEIPEKDDRLDDLYQQGITLVESVMKFGKSKEEAIEYVMTSEPFCTKSELKGMLNNYCIEKYGK